MPMKLGLGLLTAALLGGSLGFTKPVALMLGILFSLLPDADSVTQLLRGRSLFGLDHEHREGLHKPIPYIAVGVGTLAAIWNFELAVLFAAVSLTHFIRDSIGTGWGVAWFYPFTRNYYKFFTRPYGDISVTAKQIVVVWTPEEQRAVAARYGNPNYLREVYLQPFKKYPKVLIIELIGLLVGIAALLLW